MVLVLHFIAVLLWYSVVRDTAGHRHFDEGVWILSAYLRRISPIACIISPCICIESFSFPGGNCPIIGQPPIIPPSIMWPIIMECMGSCGLALAPSVARLGPAAALHPPAPSRASASAVAMTDLVLMTISIFD